MVYQEDDEEQEGQEQIIDENLINTIKRLTGTLQEKLLWQQYRY